MSNAIIGPFDNPNVPGAGQNLPGFGIGAPTNATRLDPTAVKSAIIHAIQLGYRHIQTAISSVLDHIAIGEAITDALERRFVNIREDLFITCKIEYHDDGGYDVVIQDLKKFLEKMQLEYVDLYLIQLPEQVNDETPVNDVMLIWSAMEECKKLGLTKSIGVCNFSGKMLENLLKHAKLPPSVNQVNMNMLLREKEIIEICLANKISIIASCTIGENQQHLSSTHFMEHDFLNKFAKHGYKTLEQAVIRWAYEQGANLLLESFDKEHMEEMLNISEKKLS